MRRPERIPIILEKLKKEENLIKLIDFLYQKRYLEQYSIEDTPIEDEYQKFKDKFNLLSDTWKMHPDLRLGQLMIINDFSESKYFSLFNIEDEELLTTAKILENRDIYFWGMSYDNKLKPLHKIKYTLIKDMKDSDIQAILNDVKDGDLNISQKYFNIFEKELKNRKIK